MAFSDWNEWQHYHIVYDSIIIPSTTPTKCTRPSCHRRRASSRKSDIHPEVVRAMAFIALAYKFVVGGEHSFRQEREKVSGVAF